MVVATGVKWFFQLGISSMNFETFDGIKQCINLVFCSQPQATIACSQIHLEAITAADKSMLLMSQDLYEGIVVHLPLSNLQHCTYELYTRLELPIAKLMIWVFSTSS